MSARIVTFTTDFGLADGFVGAMKGVALGVCPDLTVVDITHEVPAHDVRVGGLVLRAAHAYFPEGTIHVAVVDPGVGGPRRALLVQTEKYLFLGPDNGVLTFALEQEGARARELSNRDWFLAEVSSTFHGRDVFAPAAARVAAGAEPGDAGPEASDSVRLALPTPALEMERGGGRARIRGQVIHVDRFGNLVSNVDRACLEEALALAGRRGAHVFMQGRKVAELVRFYQEAEAGRPAALFNSWGFLEVFLPSGNAATVLRAGLEDPLVVTVG